MGRRLIYLLLLVCLTNTTFSQRDALGEFTKTYFRSNPFTRTFGEFIRHVVNDPQLENQTKQLRTDSTLFLFRGNYKRFNPFSFVPERVEVALSEQNVLLYPNRPQGDTIMLYVLIAYGDTTAKGLANVKREYDRIYRKAKRQFAKTVNEQINENGVTGEAANFFVRYAQLAPVTIEVIQGLTPAPVLRLTIRIRSRGNESVIPMSLYDSQ